VGRLRQKFAGPGLSTSQTLIVNVARQDRRFIHSFGANADFKAGNSSAVDSWDFLKCRGRGAPFLCVAEATRAQP
jgi:hypothetical protein